MNAGKKWLRHRKGKISADKHKSSGTGTRDRTSGGRIPRLTDGQRRTAAASQDDSIVWQMVGKINFQK